MLPHAQFAYYRVPHKVIGFSPLEIVYGINPCTLLDLALLPIHNKFSQATHERAKEIKKIHEVVCDRIIKANDKLKLHIDKKKKDVQFN